ncbi:mitochondrial hypoxia responsive protein [Cordyceps militaris CM01]|uniref:Mitochondrial hypoxia responsive protein n=1 Tax=Cordyceps militaris (strain CM01) TaxID=983644 RepID=G3JQE2_CORMM|nr:mitochondrial hypoxia responsive protein [Cordyceps militaris CM01]EGX89393.1 mitochondrial hypoxia responsive protein [Cordyceps militaris CM01]
MAQLPPPSSGGMPSSFDHDKYVPQLIPLPLAAAHATMYSELRNEKALHKVFRKIKEEPLVPLGNPSTLPSTDTLTQYSQWSHLGIGLTVFAFINAYRAIRRGDSKQANKMFRARVAAQGFTVIAMVAGSMYYNQDRQKTKELRKVKGETDAEEKRQKWIRELEARDDEDKAMRAMLEKQALAQVGAAAQTDGENAQAGTGGILGRMGLWGPAETKAAEEQAAANATDAAASSEANEKRRENPRSSLGALGEVYGSKKKDDGESKK